MDTAQILKADILDILFENRNKAYGAYELRKTYNKRLKTALFITLACCLIVFGVSLAAASKKKVPQLITVSDVVILHQVEPLQPPVPPPPPPPPMRAVSTIKFSTPVLTETVETPPPPQSAMDDIAIGLIDNKNGIDKDVIAPPVETHDVGKIAAPQVNDFTNEVFLVQQQARFPGGAGAWKKFLERTLRSDLPTDNGAPAGTYSVIVSFLVDKAGNVSEVRAENDPGYGTAAEAVRAIQSGPQWMPAVQNGRNVIYRQKQAITFKVEEEQ